MSDFKPEITDRGDLERRREKIREELAMLIASRTPSGGPPFTEQEDKLRGEQEEIEFLLGIDDERDGAALDHED